MPKVEGSELRAQLSSTPSIEDQRMLHKRSLRESHELQEGEALAPKVSKRDLRSFEGQITSAIHRHQAKKIMIFLK